jgi:long-chain acyl-CoA synthetase
MTEPSFISVPDMIRGNAARMPTHPALILDGRIVDYAGLDRLMDRVAASLQRDGVKPAEVISICAATSIEYAVVFLGAVRAGVTVAPLAPDTKPAVLAAMVADAGAKMLFLDKAVASSLKSAADKIPIPRIALDCSSIGRAYTEWLASPKTLPDAVAIHPDWPFNIIYSSGTTGMPKGIVQSHSYRSLQVQMFATLVGYGPDAVALVSTPLYSNMTLGSYYAALGLGCTVVLMRKFDVSGYLALAEKYRVTHSVMVPVQFQRIMGHPDFERYDLSSFRMKSCGSAPFSAALKADVLARWPGGLIEYYGMTEGGGLCVLVAHQDRHKLHTVGKPATGHEFKLIDEEGREVAPEETGELVGRSSAMMNGYHNLPEKTSEAEWFDARGRRFIRTGDIGHFDEDGYLILLDRKKDVIISGGFNVYACDLEAVLLSHADVAEAAVIGAPSERWGETPVAFVVPRSGGVTSAAALLAWTNERLGKAQRLSAAEIVVSLPRSDIGKVLKRQLRDTYKAALVDRAGGAV